MACSGCCFRPGCRFYGKNEYLSRDVCSPECGSNLGNQLQQCFYKDIEVYKLQFDLLKLMELVSGMTLYPTHNYSRVYNSASKLDDHRDRPACEVSLDICMGYEDGYCWPIMIENDNKTVTTVYLKPGDGLIYNGLENRHWRPKEHSVIKQVNCFMHYVNANGPWKDCILDLQRPAEY